MTLWWTVFFIAVLFAGSAYFSGIETGGYTVNRIRLRFRAENQDKAAKWLQAGLSDSYRFIFTVLIGNNIVNYLLSRKVTQLYLGAGVGQDGRLLFGFLPWSAEFAATLTLMLPVFFLGELIPKEIFRRRADSLMYRVSGLLLFIETLFSPLTELLKRLFVILTGEGDAQGLTLSLQSFREYFLDKKHSSVLSRHQHGMIDNVIAMQRIAVRDIMKPVSAMPALNENATVAETIDVFKKIKGEQIVVFRETKNNLTGFIDLLDIIAAGEKSEVPVKPFIRKIDRIAPDNSLARALRRLRAKKESVAIVTDRHSKTVGILHLNDVVHYIVG
ncbi:MAG: CNNM domain-containing protein [Kiritimatiellales bacterium]